MISSQSTRIAINTQQGKGIISRHIYGHFAEHLGRCIYEGMWVGEDSPIPNTDGIRNDLLQALRRIRIPNLRWPGGCFADERHSKHAALCSTHGVVVYCLDIYSMALC